MNNYKRTLLIGLSAVVVLAVLIVLLFLGLSPDAEKEAFDVPEGETTVYSAIPSDAVVILDFKEFSSFAPCFNDTLSFAHRIFQEKNGLVRFQKALLELEGLASSPFAYSLHYSAKNSVSFLQVADVRRLDKVPARIMGEKFRRYNGVDIHKPFPDLFAAQYKNLLMASTSSYVLESAIRHLDNKASILDNPEFRTLIQENGSVPGMYVNHHQTGKLFSGIIRPDFLGYSNFFLKFTSWGHYDLHPDGSHLELDGVLANNGDPSCFSNIFTENTGMKSLCGRILPASTVFAAALPFSDVQNYLKHFRLCLEIQKKAGNFAYRQKMAHTDPARLSPQEWVDSLKVEELVSAYCKFGEKCEWITLIREKQPFGLGNVISAVVDRPEVSGPEAFRYPGYISSVFGELFSHCREESFCKIGAWTVIGPQKAVAEFANGNAGHFTLEDYLDQSPMGDYLSQPAQVKLMANLKEAGDTLMNLFKDFTGSCLRRQLERNNFEWLTADIDCSGTDPYVNIDFHAAVLQQLPQAPERKEGPEAAFETDSTIVLPQGPYEVRDVSRKSKAYLEQLPNMRLRYMDAAKKGIWAIPFDTPICGRVEQIDLYSNGRLQMLFISGSKMYLLDRLGRYVYGYPVRLSKEVAYGPVLVKGLKGEKYSVLTLNADNSISWYDANGRKMPGWTDIKAPEFVKEVPHLKVLDGKKYWVLRAPSQLLLYTLDGERLEFQDRKRKIDRESGISVPESGILKVKCTDGKEYGWNLKTGKLKKI